MKWRTWLAEWLLRPLDLRIVPAAFLERTEAARMLTHTSGHLTRAYHIGRALRKLL